jgi:hypothetical protein
MASCQEARTQAAATPIDDLEQAMAADEQLARQCHVPMTPHAA